MNPETQEALKAFFAAQKKLNQLGIIRSKNYIDDIARYLCQVMYNMELVGRHAGYDGMIGTSKVQVKMNNCPTGTPVRVVEPLEFDELIAVLGPNCHLRPADIPEDFIFYRFTKEEVLSTFKSSEGKYIGGKEVLSQGYDQVLGLAGAE